MPSFNNAVNAQQQGTQYLSSAGAWSGIDASTSGFVLTSNGTGIAPSFQAGAVTSGLKVTKFTASGTFTKSTSPATKYLQIIIWGGGGGGGSGRVGIASNATFGGGGGASSGVIWAQVDTTQVGATETVTVGAGGGGGVSPGTAANNGNPGNPPGATSFGNLVIFDTSGNTFGSGGGGGSGVGALPVNVLQLTFGAQSIPMGGGNSATASSGVNGTDNLTTFAFSSIIPTGGGGGGGIDASNNVRNGGRGGQLTNRPGTVIINGGTAGTTGAGQAGGDGNAASTITSGGVWVPGTGGGGGASNTGATAGKGGNGGIPGGGGGGGGASQVGFNSGQGGDGARGEIWVYEYF
jgi:hypothetical protein